QRELQQGLPVAVERQKVAQFLEHWMSEVAKHKLATSTFESYDSKIRLHVLPQLGRLTLAKLTPQHLTRLYSMLLDEGLSPGTARYIHAILHKALEQAVRWNLIARNPADAVDPPRPGRGEI